MITCAYEGCDDKATTSALLSTGTMRNYCNEHTRKIRDEHPELVTEFDQL